MDYPTSHNNLKMIKAQDSRRQEHDFTMHKGKCKICFQQWKAVPMSFKSSPHLAGTGEELLTTRHWTCLQSLHLAAYLQGTYTLLVALIHSFTFHICIAAQLIQLPLLWMAKGVLKDPGGITHHIRELSCTEPDYLHLLPLDRLLQSLQRKQELQWNGLHETNQVKGSCWWLSSHQ